MAEPPPTRLHIDPPMDQWRITPRNGRIKPLIATGHQPTLWHPGILAKYLAADVFAERIGGSAANVVVDHNALDLNRFPYPVIEGQRLARWYMPWDQRIKAAYMPPNLLPPLEPTELTESVERALATEQMPPSVAEGLRQISDVYGRATGHENAAEQVSAVLAELMKPLLKRPLQVLTTTNLITPKFIDRLLADPVGCVRCYNRAALAYPEANIPVLYLGRDVVELPLWSQGEWAVTPVYADLGDSNHPHLFTTKYNQDLDLNGENALSYLCPRAVTLSAIMRSEHCDMFIHGTGGGVYDQVTERWWQDWTGEDLAPKAIVSADMYLPFDLPVATPEQHTRAQWFAHHLPHNVDRYAKAMDRVSAALSREKQGLLGRMNDDRDKRRRSAAFTRIHAINAELSRLHQTLIQSAKQNAEDAHVGIANQAIANRRDWCFALYPEEQLRVLKQRTEASLTK